MGCVSSTFLEDDERRIIGVSASSASHVVSLTSSTYGILATLAAADPKSPSRPVHTTPPPPPPPPPPLSCRSRPAPPPEAQADSDEAEVINSWELMAGLLDPSTPAKSKSSSPRVTPNSGCCSRDDREKARPPRCIRFPLRPIDGNSNNTSSAAARLPRPPPVAAAAAAERCPPGGAHCAVLYTTTLRGVRATFEACNAVRAALHSHGVAFRERDVSMDRGFRDELRALLLSLPTARGQGQAAAAAVPRLFVRGRHVGGAEEVARLDEEGALAPLLEGLPRARPGGWCCDGCGGMRFLPCFECSGSRKVVVVSGAGGVDGKRNGRGGSRGVVLRCGECNENGLVLCPICS